MTYDLINRENLETDTRRKCHLKGKAHWRAQEIRREALMASSLGDSDTANPPGTFILSSWVQNFCSWTHSTAAENLHVHYLPVMCDKLCKPEFGSEDLSRTFPGQGSTSKTTRQAELHRTLNGDDT